MMRALRLPEGGSPASWGAMHGEGFREEIRALAEIRLDLAHRVGGFAGRAAVLEAARAHLPLLERWDAALHAELLGVAEGAGLEPERVVVLNHYTDLRDLGPAAVGSGAVEDDCTALVMPGGQGPVLAQTWDMHGSARSYVMMLRVPAREAAGRRAPAAWLLSITGCLGMAGMNAAGVGLTINNLRSHDARVGAIWPALVRRVLRERTAEAARDALLAAPVGSGHHYLVADPGSAFGLETSGRRKERVYEGSGGPYHHTNHPLAPAVAEVSSSAPTSTTLERYDRVTRWLEGRSSARPEEIWALLGDHEGYPRGLCTHLASAESPHAMATCAGVAMLLSARELWAAAGCLHGVAPERFHLDPEEPR